jgi:hypothetical protein
MSDTPWKTNDYFVSPWNYVPEVTENFKFAKKIKVHDITLRDGEQQAGIEFTMDDKIRIAEGLAEAGVHRIEAGMPVVSPQDAQAIKEIVKRNLGPEIFAFSRCMVEDVKRAVDCGVNGIVMEVPSSEHIIKYAYRWPLEKAIETSVKSTLYAKEQGLQVVGGEEVLGHLGAGLDALGIDDPAREVAAGVQQGAGSDALAAGDVGEVGAAVPVGGGSLDGMAEGAGFAEEDGAAVF